MFRRIKFPDICVVGAAVGFADDLELTFLDDQYSPHETSVLYSYNPIQMNKTH